MLERLAIVETKLEGIDERMGRLEGRMDRLEGRMDRIEGRLDGMDGRLRGVEIGLATLTERVAHLPSKGFIWGAVLTLLTATSAVVLLADRIQAVLGL